MPFYQRDYILRQIEMMGQFLSRVVYGKGQEAEELQEERTSGQRLPGLESTLLELVDAGKVNEAENLLFAKIEEERRPEYLRAAVRFYEELMNLPPDALEKAGFSEDEIVDGLLDVRRLYGMDGVVLP